MQENNSSKEQIQIIINDANDSTIDTNDTTKQLEKVFRQKKYYYTHTSSTETTPSKTTPTDSPEQTTRMLKKSYIENLSNIITDSDKLNELNREDDTKTFISDGLGSEPSDSDTSNDLFDDMQRENSAEMSPGIYEIEYDSVQDTDSRTKSPQNTNNYHPLIYRKLSYNDVRRQINHSYELDTVHRYSSALDILASYLKGQKIIYMETRNQTTRLLHLLMIVH